MASTAPVYSAGGMSIGRIISRGFGIIAANPLASLVISLVFGGVQTLLRPGAEGLTTGHFSRQSIIMFAVALVGGTVVGALAYGVYAPAAVAYAQGQRVTAGEWTGAIARALMPMIALAVITTVATFVGFILLFVPGIIISLMWLVAGPALVAEGGGVANALGRSRYLTKGARWHIVGLELVVAVMLWLVTAVFGVLRFAVLGLSSLTAPPPASAVTIAISIITYASIAVISAAINSALYIDLCDWKDGTDPGNLAAIFR